MSKDKCPKCGQPVEASARFCSSCGASLTGKSQSQKGKKAAGHMRRDITIIVALLIVVTGGYFIYTKPPASPTPEKPAETFAHPPVEGMDAQSAALLNLPTDYESLVKVGNQTMDQGNYAVAAECYKRALAMDGRSPDVRTDYGACLHGMGLANRAIEEFMKVIAEHPRHAVANFNLGIVYSGEEQSDSARVYFKRYLDIEPDGSLAPTVKKYLEELGG